MKEVTLHNEPAVECVYTAGGCNRSPHCMSWNKTKIIYGCCNAINLVDAYDISSQREVFAKCKGVQTIFSPC